jgi:hypothetical protein
MVELAIFNNFRHFYEDKNGENAKMMIMANIFDLFWGCHRHFRHQLLTNDENGKLRYFLHDVEYDKEGEKR